MFSLYLLVSSRLTQSVFLIYSFLYLRDNGWDFMPARVWIGLWTSAFILIIVIFNLSALVKYITRFTEESFATLIAVIFIVEAFKKLFSIQTDYPVHFKVDDPVNPDCACMLNCSFLNSTIANTDYSTLNVTPSFNLSNSKYEVEVPIY